MAAEQTTTESTATAQTGTQAATQSQTQQQAPSALAGGESKGATQETKPGVTENGQSKDTKAVPADLELKLPDGVKADLAEFKAIAKEVGLDSAKAQKLADLHFKTIAQIEAKSKEDRAAQSQGWFEQIKADKEMGGAKFDETVALAKKAVARFGGDALQKALMGTGFDNHPELVRAFAKIGRAISEDSIAGKLNGATAQAEFKPNDLYPSMQPKSA